MASFTTVPPDQKCLHTELQRKIAGYLTAFGVSTSGALIIVCGQLLGTSVPATETNLFRFIFQTCFAVVFMVVFKVNPKLPFQWKPLLVMALSISVTFMAGLLFILSSWYLPVAVVQGSMETIVMLLAAVLAIFLKKCTPELPIAVIICTVGCVLLSQPEFMFGASEKTFCDNNGNHSTQINASISINDSNCHPDDKEASMEQFYGFMSVLGLAICLWIHTQFNVNYLAQFTTVISILFWLGVGCTVLSLPTMFIIDTPVIVKDPFNIGMVILFAASFTLNNYLIMYSVTLIPFSHIAIILPTAMVYLFVFQRTFLKDIQPGPENSLEIVGLVLVILGACIPPTLDIFRESRKEIAKNQVDDNLSDEDKQTIQEQTHIMNKDETTLGKDYGTEL